MKKIKVSKATGVVLDWLVHTASWAEQPDIQVWKTDYYDRNKHRYSTDWATGGPIIERKRISIEDVANREWSAWVSGILACQSQFAKTPLMAAMRCYVASELGAEVEVPEELPA